MAASSGPRYEPDEDGLRREIVGPWVRDKHVRLASYIGISRAVRAKFLGPRKGGATYIELFCGPGRARVENETSAIDGSPLVAWQEAVRGKAAFTQVHIADADPALAAAAEARLRGANAPVSVEHGPANETVDRIVKKLNPDALHFAFLDPYNLAALPFEIIRKLAAIKRMDILIHVSVQDLQRNLRKYAERQNSPLDAFAPGWREHAGDARAQHLVRGKILEHWRHLLRAQGMSTAETHERVTGPKNQPLYWLALAARHDLALKFWEKIRDIRSKKQLPLI